MSIESREVILVRAEDLEAVRGVVLQVLTSWQRAWGCVIPEGELNVEEAHAASGVPSHGAWRHAGKQDTHGWWFYQGEGATGQLVANILTPSSSQSIINTDWSLRAAQAALDDLTHALRQALCRDTRGSGASNIKGDVLLNDALAVFSGSLLVSLPALGMKWLCGRSTYAHLVPARKHAVLPVAKPVSLPDVFANRRLKVAVQIGGVDVALADFLSLKPGDVIRFPTAIDQTAKLALVGSQSVKEISTCYLGQSQGRLAVSLSPAATAAQGVDQPRATSMQV